MWIAEVRAESIKRAYSLLARQVGAPRGGRGAGIVMLDSSAGPHFAGWPWDLPMSQYGPGWSADALPPKGWPTQYDEIIELERTADRRARQRLGMENQVVLSRDDVISLGDAIDDELRSGTSAVADEAPQGSGARRAMRWRESVAPRT